MKKVGGIDMVQSFQLQASLGRMWNILEKAGPNPLMKMAFVPGIHFLDFS